MIRIVHSVIAIKGCVIRLIADLSSDYALRLRRMTSTSVISKMIMRPTIILKTTSSIELIIKSSSDSTSKMVELIVRGFVLMRM